MIETRLTVLGEKEIAAQFALGPGAIRGAIKGELAEIGDEITSRASALAPKRTGALASRMVWYFGGEATRKQQRSAGFKRFGSIDPDAGPVLFTVRPTGSVAHLMERGVNATRKQHTRKVTRTASIWTRKGKKEKTFKATALVKAHPFKIAPHPFFVPAVDSVGGVSGVNARLQAALLKRAPELMRGSA